MAHCKYSDTHFIRHKSGDVQQFPYCQQENDTTRSVNQQRMDPTKSVQLKLDLSYPLCYRPPGLSKNWYRHQSSL